MKKIILMIVGAMLLIGCSSMHISQLDAHTKRLPTNNKATILLSKIIDLDKYNTLLLVPEGPFIKGQMSKIEYFKELVTPNELKMKMIARGLGKTVPSTEDTYIINEAAKFYKSFLWFRLHKHINLDGYYGQFILTNPKTFEDYFIADIKLPSTLKGTGDRKVWYPLFNAFIDYIEQNSKSWQEKIKNKDDKNNTEPRVLELIKKKNKNNTSKNTVKNLFNTLK